MSGRGSSRRSPQTRILVISQVPPPVHGSTVMTAFLIDVLRERGDAVQLVDRRFSRSVSEIGHFSLRKVLSAAALPVRLLHRLLVFKPEAVIFFATNRTFSFVVDVAMSAVLRITPARKVFYLHTRGFSSLAGRSPIFRRLVRALFVSADDVVCLGPSLAADVAEVWSGPVSLIPNATEPPSGLPPHEAVHVLYLSNLIPEKGADVFVSLANDLSPEFPNVPFVVAGASSDEDFHRGLLRRAEALGDRMRFLGGVTDQSVKWELLSRAIVLVFPSSYPFEAQPLTILEAMAVGTPVVAFDVGGVRDIVRDGVTGFIVPVGDVVALKQAVSVLLRNPALRERMAADSRRAFELQYSTSAFRQKWSAIVPSGGA